MDIVAEIESHFSCSLPTGFRLWTQRHYTDQTGHPSNYLWVDDAEWIPPTEITTRELFRDTHIPGLIPFAFTGGADYWCFNTSSGTAESEYEIILCYTDDDADVFAPSFAGWFYRTCIQFSVCISGAELEQAQQYMSVWAARLAEFDASPWPGHLRSLSTKVPFQYPNDSMVGLLTEAEAQQIIATEFGDRYIDTQVPWGWYEDEDEDA